jgi:hypothetical protein
MGERKYQQRGYRGGDERRTEKPARPADGTPRAPAPPPHQRDAPRGRGLGAPTEAVFRCARCGETALVGAAMALGSRCERCGADLHSCANCSAFDPAAHFECRREIPARVAPKDRENRCELFDPRTRQEFVQEKLRQGGDARSAFDALFKS